ncbi:hypothetical protein K503DRAFT_732428 [Rhizopogon vinicolor AM-OR11-026]|uniref:F-box domain-containing protein n=1 Tax=Rhizopogon vinicolor AM-OR11-026 TaxID=1314800 RepID=A0A1B7NDS2_9AGAM|nr:hypothetical protein K503DRAFT_732428 [Rhizopogon vinicolor AM-OR11-026]
MSSDTKPADHMPADPDVVMTHPNQAATPPAAPRPQLHPVLDAVELHMNMPMNSWPKYAITGTADYKRRQDFLFKDHVMKFPPPGTVDTSARDVSLSTMFMHRMAHLQQTMELQGPAVKNDPRFTYLYDDMRFKRNIFYWRTFRLNDLPSEIISHIFRIAVWSTSTPADGTHIRLLLTAVCRKWRRSMIQDCTLWSAIWFRDPPPYARSLEWFKRAGGAPLDIRINEHDADWKSKDDDWRYKEDDHRFTADQMEELLDKIFVKVSQIRMLVLVVDNWPPALVVLHKLQEAAEAGNAINMERLEIHRMGQPFVWLGSGFEVKGRRSPVVLFGGQTQALKYLCLSGVHIDWNATPLSNLSTLDLRKIAMNVAPTLDRFREVLLACPRLHKLSLDGAGPQPAARRPDHDPVDLPHLKVLIIGGFSMVYSCYVFSQFKAPNVRDLTLMNLTGDDYAPMIILITGRFRELQLLTLYTVNVNPTEVGKKAMVRFLYAIPSLNYLRIASMKWHVIEIFNEDPQAHGLGRDSASQSLPENRLVLCPRLQTIEFQQMSGKNIAEWAVKRKELGAPLKRAYVNSPYVSKVTAAEADMIQKVVGLYIAPLGSTTPEERELATRDDYGAVV